MRDDKTSNGSKIDGLRRDGRPPSEPQRVTMASMLVVGDRVAVNRMDMEEAIGEYLVVGYDMLTDTITLKPVRQ